MEEEELFPSTGQSVKDGISDENLQLVTGQIVVGQTVLVAYAIGLFKALLDRSLLIKELAKLLNLSVRAVQGLISCACSMQLVECKEGLYQLTRLGRCFFDEKSPTYYGGVFDLYIQQNELMNFSTIKDAVLHNSPQIDGGKGLFSGDDSFGSTHTFVKAIHQKAIAPSFHWANLLNLSNCKNFIDVAGGSGIHTIAACMKNQNLNGIVCDKKPVLTYTTEYINHFGLQDRIQTKELDIWKDPFPQGDAFFFADIFHDWDKERDLLLAKKAYDSMPTNGRIIIHEMLFNDDKTGPMLTSAYNIKMLLWTEGEQYSFKEIKELLGEVGFRDIQKLKALGNWSLVIGHK